MTRGDAARLHRPLFFRSDSGFEFFYILALLRFRICVRNEARTQAGVRVRACVVNEDQLVLYSPDQYKLMWACANIGVLIGTIFVQFPL